MLKKKKCRECKLDQKQRETIRGKRRTYSDGVKMVSLDHITKHDKHGQSQNTSDHLPQIDPHFQCPLFLGTGSEEKTEKNGTFLGFEIVVGEIKRGKPKGAYW